MDIYLMGIGGTAMGALAGLLKSQGHRVRGSDSAVYSPMKEKLVEWGINYKTPYDAQNLDPKPDLVIVGNVIRRDNPEAVVMRDLDLAHDSLPRALKRLFLENSCSIVASGTHGKTTCSALLAHVLHTASHEPGFLIGGIPVNFGESFRAPKNQRPCFVIEGDEYDTAYFDKGPKFMHYKPDLLLITSIEFDHADIYRDLDAVIDAFAKLLATMSSKQHVIVNHSDQNIRQALKKSNSTVNILSYGPDADYQALAVKFDNSGITFDVTLHNNLLGEISVPLFGQHNLANALGCYALLHQYGLTHHQIALGFASFAGVKRRLEIRAEKNNKVIIDDFAHHPTAVRETIKAARQRFPQQTIVAIFEPRSATSATNIFTDQYISALSTADQVILAPVGRNLPEDQKLPTHEIARVINQQGISASAHDNYDDFKQTIVNIKAQSILLFMSNGDLGGHMSNVESLI